MAAQAKLPPAVQAQLVGYLGLFRPEKRSLTGARTVRLVRELADLVAAGAVDWDRQPPRPCPPALWAEGMRLMVERKGGQRTHFENHNYLRAIVYDLANAADAERERRYHAAAAKGRAGPAEGGRTKEEAPEAPADETPVDVRELLAGLAGKLGVKR